MRIELDYVEQTSWILFLKYLDDFEKDKKTAAELSGKTYTNIIAPEYQWTKWAAPKLVLSGAEGGKEDAKDILGDVANISSLFIEFQKHLYQQKVA